MYIGCTFYRVVRVGLTDNMILSKDLEEVRERVIEMLPPPTS